MQYTRTPGTCATARRDSFIHSFIHAESVRVTRTAQDTTRDVLPHMCAPQRLSKSAYQERQSRTGFVPSFVRPFRRTGAFILVDGMKGTTAVLLPQGSGDVGGSVLVQEALAEHGIDDAGILESYPRQSPGLLGTVSAATIGAAIADSSTGLGTTVRMGMAVSGISYWLRGYYFLFFLLRLSLVLCLTVPSPSVFSVFWLGGVTGSLFSAFVLCCTPASFSSWMVVTSSFQSG